MFKIMTAGEFFGNYYYNWVLVFFLIYLMVLIYRTAKKQLDNFDVLTAFVYMSTVAASVIYAYGSGGRAFEAAFLATTFIVICYGVRAATYVVKYFISRKNSPP